MQRGVHTWWKLVGTRGGVVSTSFDDFGRPLPLEEILFTGYVPTVPNPKFARGGGGG